MTTYSTYDPGPRVKTQMDKLKDAFKRFRGLFFYCNCKKEMYCPRLAEYVWSKYGSRIRVYRRGKAYRNLRSEFMRDSMLKTKKHSDSFKHGYNLQVSLKECVG